MKNSWIVIFAICLLTACDTIKDPIPPSTTPNGGGNEGPVRRRVLLEDFTGHKCNNCPAAANTAQQIQTTYGEDVIVVGIHTTETFAAPQPGPNGSYTTDFRTPAGDIYEDAFDISWLPAGMVNRSIHNESQLLAHAAWPAAVSDMIGELAAFDIWFNILDHSPNTNTINVEVMVAVLEPVQGNHALTIYLTEDHVIDWQYDAQSSDPNVPDYEHRHVLRNNLNGAWGTPVISASANVGDTIPLVISNFAVSPDWNANNCALVAYVYATETNEVMQVVEQKFYP